MRRLPKPSGTAQSQRHAIFRRDDRLWPARTRGHRRSRNHPARGRSRASRPANTRTSASFTKSPMPRSRISPPKFWRRPRCRKSATKADLQASRFDHARDLRKAEARSKPPTRSFYILSGLFCLLSKRTLDCCRASCPCPDRHWRRCRPRWRCRCRSGSASSSCRSSANCRAWRTCRGIAGRGAPAAGRSALCEAKPPASVSKWQTACDAFHGRSFRNDHDNIACKARFRHRRHPYPAGQRLRATGADRLPALASGGCRQRIDATRSLGGMQRFRPAPCGATSPLRRAAASSPADETPRSDGTADSIAR